MITLFDKEQKLPPPTVQEGDIVKVETPLSTFIKEFLDKYEAETTKYAHGPELTIRVSEVLGTIAHIYERIRNVVEYKGEHVLRRNAIERILKRLLWERSSHDIDRIAQVLLRELIWARYIANDTLPRGTIKVISRIISKYLYVLSRLIEKGSSLPERDLRNWIWGVASSEIEESIDPSNREPYVELMYDWFTAYFNWNDVAVPQHDRELQIYLAIHRALVKSDEPILRYHLLLKGYPDWPNAHQNLVDQVVEGFYRIYEHIEKQLNYLDKHALYRIILKQVAPFEVLRTLVKDEGLKVRTILPDQEKFEWKIREICQRKYSQIQKKVNRGIVRSILYIFITKVLLALLIEIPFELYRLGRLTYVPLSINVIVPPAMMWFIGLTIKAPGEDNTVRILKKMNTIVYLDHRPNKTTFSVLKVSRGNFLTRIFAGFYLVLFVLVFGGITYLLLQLEYTWLGLFIFFAFLSLVLLFGFRVRFTASELKVTSEKEGFFSYIFYNLTLPFLSTGVYLSKGLARINFLTVLLDFLIEAPLKTIIEVFEEWTSFIREKREEVVEVPE